MQTLQSSEPSGLTGPLPFFHEPSNTPSLSAFKPSSFSHLYSGLSIRRLDGKLHVVENAVAGKWILL